MLPSLSAACRPPLVVACSLLVACEGITPTPLRIDAYDLATVNGQPVAVNSTHVLVGRVSYRGADCDLKAHDGKLDFEHRRGEYKGFVLFDVACTDGATFRATASSYGRFTDRGGTVTFAPSRTDGLVLGQAVLGERVITPTGTTIDLSTLLVPSEPGFPKAPAFAVDLVFRFRRSYDD